jgi:methyl-accepting chemotaxis protein
MTCVVTVIVALAVTGVINYFAARTYNDEAIERDLRSVSDGHSLAISEWIGMRLTMVQSFRPEQLDGDPTEAVSQLKLGDNFSSTYVGFPDKRSVRNIGYVAIEVGYDPTSRPWYKQAVSAGTAVLGKPYADSSTHKLVVLLLHLFSQTEH